MLAQAILNQAMSELEELEELFAHDLAPEPQESAVGFKLLAADVATIQKAHSERELADQRARFESELAKQSAVLRASLQQNFSKAMELFQEGRERGHQKVSGWFDFDADTAAQV